MSIFSPTTLLASKATPADVPDLALWLRADDGLFTDAGTTPAVNNGDAIYRWADRSGNSRHFDQTTSGNRPQLQNSVVNGKPIVDFDGVDDYLTGSDLSALTAGELFIVVAADADPAVAPALGGWGFGADTTGSSYPYTDGVIYDQFGTTVRKTVGNPTPSLASFRLYNTISISGEWTANLDGTQIYTTATNTVGFSTVPRIGFNNDAHYFGGRVAEFIMYGAKLTSSDRSAVKSYIANKYALTIA